MRSVVAIACLFLAACGDGGAGEAGKQKAAAAAAAKNLQLTPGQWESTAEVTRLTQQDKAPKPAIDTPVGTKSTASACITEAQAKDPPPVLLAGSDAYSCTPSNSYVSGGSLSTSLDCTRKGVKGRISMSLNGTYTADTLEAEQSLSTFLPGEGDANIVSKLTARRVGECTAQAGKAG